MKKVFFVFFALLNSCTIYHNGSFQNSTVLNQRNFVYKGMAEGEVKEIYLFGIGLGNQRNLVRQAHLNMKRDFPLKNGQAYANTSVDMSLNHYLLWTTRKAIISADLVEFTTGENITTGNTLPKMETEMPDKEDIIALPEVVDSRDWEKVIVTYNPKDVQNLTPSRKLKATHTAFGFPTKDNLAKMKNTLETDLRKQAASLACPIILIIDYDESKGAIMQGMAYKK